MQVLTDEDLIFFTCREAVFLHVPNMVTVIAPVETVKAFESERKDGITGSSLKEEF